MNTKDIVQAQKALNQKSIQQNQQEALKRKESISAGVEAQKDANAKSVAESRIMSDGLRTPNIQVVDTTQSPIFNSSDIMKKTDDEVTLSKLNSVTGLKESDENALASDRKRTIKAGQESLAAQKKLTGIKDDGSVDIENKGSIGASLQSDFDTFKKKQEDLSSQFESAQKSRVVGQIRSGLLARGIDIQNISPEKMIALSDEVGAKAFGNIYQNKEDTLKSITNKQDLLTSRLNDLREKGAIAEDKFRSLKATVDSEFEKAKNNVQRTYINDIFGIKDTADQKKEAIKTTGTNTLEGMLKYVSAADAVNLRGIYQDLLNKNIKPTEIYQRIANDKRFQDAVRTKIANEQAVMGREEGLKQAKSEAEIMKLLSSANTQRAATTKTNPEDKLATPAEIKAVVDAYQSKGYSAGNIPDTLTKGQARELIIKAANINTK